MADGSAPWPCELSAAQTVKIEVATAGTAGGTGGGAGGGFGGGTGPAFGSKTLVAHAELELSEIQDLGDLIPQLLEIKNKSGSPLVFSVQIEFGDGVTEANAESTAAVNNLLESLNDGFHLQ